MSALVKLSFVKIPASHPEYCFELIFWVFRYSANIFDENIVEYYENTMKNYTHNIQAKLSDIRDKSLDERYHTIDDKSDKKENIKEIANNFDL